jgi:hypothetical protein
MTILPLEVANLTFWMVRMTNVTGGAPYMLFPPHC